ncbi:MAG: hypothetical protein ACR2PY_06645 [Salinispira sp.]
MYLSKIRFIGEKPLLLVIAAFFFISLFFILFHQRGVEKVIFFFPDDVYATINREYRIIPRKRGLTERVGAYMDEYILGPSDFRSHIIFSRNSTIQSLFYLRGGDMILNLQPNSVQTTDEISMNTALTMVREGILMNFPRIRTVRFLVQGQEMFATPYVAE